MGKLANGILGGFSGKVGNVIGGNWKGIDYMRIQPASVRNANTELQQKQRNRFSTVLHFQQPLVDFLRIGFRGYAIRMTAFNAAMSYNLHEAVTGDFPDYEIDYSKALLSRGNLTGALNPTVASAEAGKVTVSWDDNSGTGSAKGTDRAMIALYNPGKKDAISVLDAGSRADGSAEITVPDIYSGDQLECFVSFIALDQALTESGKNTISDSDYAGSVTVA